MAAHTSEEISAVFVTHAAGVLGDTDRGLSGQDIVAITAAYAVDSGVDAPHPTAPLTVNKRTALRQNLMALPTKARYQAILDLCNHPTIQPRNPDGANKLKMTLVARYGHLSEAQPEWAVSHGLISGTQGWLDAYPKALALYNQALAKYESGALRRNCLDDLRLALELLIRGVLGNEKSLDNQVAPLGTFLKARGGSPGFRNMFVRLIEYYAMYQNTYVKHDDAVMEEEVEFILELTSSFAKHLVRLASRDAG